MKTIGLIGRSLKHSASQAYFEEKLQKEGIRDWSYHLFELSSIEELPDLLAAHPDLVGFNVTFPYKEHILPYLDALDDTAKQIGAVNVVTVQHQDGKFYLTGHNSDAAGFAQTLDGISLPSRALLLGTGGAARAVAFALHQKGVSCQLVSRSGKASAIRYQDVDETLLSAHRLIVNCTPLGTAGLHEEEIPPLPYHALTQEHRLYDLVYNPAVTPFLRQGLAHRCQLQNGLAMLHAQADIAWKIFSKDLSVN
ncbi:MAG: shikimate dehydrogenase [Bacteroidales bacterium]|nr:shikimate dehydrogenase [Bacteroidales bacterium]